MVEIRGQGGNGAQAPDGHEQGCRRCTVLRGTQSSVALVVFDEDLANFAFVEQLFDLADQFSPST